MLSISEPFTLERKYFSMICEAACREDCEKMAVMLEQEMQRIMDFFGLKELSRNLMIYMTSSREVYKAHMEKIAGQNESIQYFDWMIADTYDNDINLLSLEACHEIEMHKEFDEEEYRKLIVHEFCSHLPPPLFLQNGDLGQILCLVLGSSGNRSVRSELPGYSN